MGIFDKIFSKKEPVQNSVKLMDENQFWNIIHATIKNSSGDYEKQQSELNTELSKLTAIEILEFDNKFRTLRGKAYIWELWAGAYIMNGGCSDDCFSDFRGWLIGQGKEVYDNAMRNPETLVELNYDFNNDDWEGLSYVPRAVYLKKTGGKEMPNGIRENLKITGEEWAEDGAELKAKFPKLHAKWGID
ncbi:DUF4240 domain-containing protein [Aequorivita sp. F47161]|uniref:DUF4240 domain-containing protein n=1 Tax=Aequorivita vitellina TaxID=2874475 RepID=A0A9X1QTV7_9FLAO|nr:DUF4240 domain-containing protein [Aequorivita vitellina]MCG2418260.1 DUF4240 domain-containing protein [Aequorivita vitellina]